MNTNKGINVYKISSERQLKIASFFLILFTINFSIIIITPLQFDIKVYYLLASIFSPIPCFSFPTLYLHIQYFLENKDTELRINEKENTIQIKRKDEVYDYMFRDIVDSVVHYSIYYKNRNKVRRKKAPFTDYLYWYLEFNDDKKFVFTSFMIDISIAHKIVKTDTIHDFVTFIRKNEVKKEERKRLEEKKREEARNNLKMKYSMHSKERLEEMLSSESYSNKEKKIFKELLSKKD